MISAIYSSLQHSNSSVLAILSLVEMNPVSVQVLGYSFFFDFSAIDA